MKAESLILDNQNCLKLLPDSFNKRRLNLAYFTVNNYLNEIQNLGKKQCLGMVGWPEIDAVSAWMISSETATFMKAGGLGMIASELPEAFNSCFADKGEKITVVTPLYLGDTGKKKAVLKGGVIQDRNAKALKLTKLRLFGCLLSSKIQISLRRLKLRFIGGVLPRPNIFFLPISISFQSTRMPIIRRRRMAAMSIMSSA